MRIESDHLVQLQQVVYLPGSCSSRSQEYHREGRGGRDRREDEIVLRTDLHQFLVQVDTNFIADCHKLPGSLTQTAGRHRQSQVAWRCWRNTFLGFCKFLKVMSVVMVVTLVVMMFFVCLLLHGDLSYSRGYRGGGRSGIFLLVGR